MRELCGTWNKDQFAEFKNNDIWIAASSMETGSRLLSCDKHFSPVPGLILVDFYSVVDRNPRPWPWMNETFGGILGG